MSVHKPVAELTSDMEELLMSFADVFPKELPKGLHPSRHCDHRIVLLKDSIPPRHCLYRVLLNQKEELKRQIDDFLASGHIERAQSPFGAGVMFVENTTRPSAFAWTTVG